MNEIIKQECAGQVFGHNARFFGVVANTETGRILNQKIGLLPKEYTAGGRRYRIRASIRFDDECHNNHESFSITGDIHRWDGGAWREDSCGCLHDEIAQHYPGLAPLIKWHLTSTDGPMHYIANTLYHAGDRDCHGLRKGERRQIRNGRTGLPAWQMVAIDKAGQEVPL